MTKDEFINQAIDCRFIEEIKDDKRVLSEMIDSLIQTAIEEHDKMLIEKLQKDWKNYGDSTTWLGIKMAVRVIKKLSKPYNTEKP